MLEECGVITVTQNGRERVCSLQKEKLVPVTEWVADCRALWEGKIDSFYESLVEDENYFPTFAFHQDWVSLYETWNMAFILGELNNLHYLFPKLLIPSVLNAKSENFLGARIIALWLSINNTLFLNFNNVEKIHEDKDSFPSKTMN